ncbi:conserved hypothetical protein [Theileria orientalis strain Shintoku]|uniref:Uncharacterized protein n=1 Tax=Theileria orientalis strain Shintoku TaxID=869250 RepID=J4C8R1_THEOR|nr:conserved hypothetical protein [Theileria orientalis strain Shintoku]BAM41228.1 conserved hypothetical protein [Theileria orientalis strain Shintoku]|eukprot:XP_009691529.1 conserved hypothetical protein [Theileria orientalis strain Shintoku]
MESDIDMFIKSTGREVSSDFPKSGDATQSAPSNVFGGLSGNQLYYSIEILQKPGEECLDSESDLKDSDISNDHSISTSCTSLAENNATLSEGGALGKSLADIQQSDKSPKVRSKNTGSEGTTKVPDMNCVETTDKDHQTDNKSNKTESLRMFGKGSTEDVSKSLLGNMTKKFSNLCEILDTEKLKLKKLDQELKISKILHSKDFNRDLNLSRNVMEKETTLMEDLKGSAKCDDVVEYLAKKKRKKKTSKSKSQDSKGKKSKKKRRSCSPSILSILEALEKGDPLDSHRESTSGDEVKNRHRRKRAEIEEYSTKEQSDFNEYLTDKGENPLPTRTLDASKEDTPKTNTTSVAAVKNDKSLKLLGQKARTEKALNPSEQKARTEKALNPSEQKARTEKASAHSEAKTGTVKTLTFEESATSTERAFAEPENATYRETATDSESVTDREFRRAVMDTDVLENLDKMGGIKYETGSVDLRRKYRSFERLCFGLGCTVPPTKQELEMCSQLSLWGDDSSLSQYETSVYQSCLLRSRAFESIWTKFCNRVIGMIRRYTLEGLKNLLKIVNEEHLVEPFLKVVQVDLGSDRQDQQLFISILQEELTQKLSSKQILLKLTVKNNDTVDDAVNQIYIQMYQLLLLKGEKSWNDTHFSGDNLLNGLVNLYENYFADHELLVIIDKINPIINDILYMFQMLKRRRLMRVNSVLLVCSNNEYLERYCNSLIYSNLGIFECSMFMISCLVDDIVQVLLYDTKVQDFIPNFRMVMEIYDTFANQDSSLTLMILRVYQLYEQYYNKQIFSHLSIVPPFVFESGGGAEDKYDIVMDLKAALIMPGLFRHRHGSGLPVDCNMATTENNNLTTTSNIFTNTNINTDTVSNNNINIDTVSNTNINTDTGSNNNNSLLPTNKNTSNQVHTVTDTSNSNSNNQQNTNSTTQHKSNDSVRSVNNGDEKTSGATEAGSGASGETMGYMVDLDYKDNSEVEFEQYGDTNRMSMLKRAKRMYSVYSLLSISNNMSENYVAYLELKLVEELDLQKVILELLPLNTLILMQRRILFQLGVNFLYKLLVFIPDSAIPTHRITHIIDAMPMFDPKASDDAPEELEKPLRDLIKRVVKYIHKKCHLNQNKREGIELLKNILESFNCHYKSVIQTAMDIQLLLDGGRNVYETDRMINEFSTILDIKMPIPKLVKEIRHKLHLCFFPLIVTFKLSDTLVVQPYTNAFRTTPSAQMAPTPAPATTTLTTSAPSAPPAQGEAAKDSVDEKDIILYIHKYIRYKIINMWKLFIIYYYIATTRQGRPVKPQGLVEIYVKFNVNIELLEKIHRIVLLSQNTSAALASKDSLRSLQEKKLPEGDVQLCLLMKNSLSNINVKFL